MYAILAKEPVHASARFLQAEFGRGFETDESDALCCMNPHVMRACEPSNFTCA